MGWFSLEHGRAAHAADFIAYGSAVTVLAGGLLCSGPSPAQAMQVLLWALAGLMAWTALEYGLHRFVLHGLPPFKRWHADHHARPTALLGAPTLLSASLLAALLLGPAWMLGDRWRVGGLVLGMLSGYLGYALTHHALHHARSAEGSWLRRRQRWHARHHQGLRPACYGVTSGFWDRVGRSA